MADFATTDDLATFWRSLSAAESDRAEMLLVMASAVIRSAWPDIDSRLAAAGDPLDASVAQLVALSMVKRAMLNVVEGVTQTTSQIGPFIESQAFANPAGSLQLTPDERRLLSPGGVRPRAFAVDMTPAGAGTGNVPFWGAEA